ncbi:MAG: sugar phosphate isomerase/epimerase [Candidatus Atribacteria bacterium]|nr:sugar phosphate isomerase/epimerase [Candidatus Atribacteria bacterium]
MGWTKGEKMDFGISTMIFHREYIGKLLPYLNQWNIKLIEIRPHTGHFELQDSHLIEQLKEKIDYFKISVSAIHMPMNGVDISHLEEYERVKSIREIEKTIVAAFRLGAELVVVHPGGKYSNNGERKQKLKLAIMSIREIAEFCQEWNIKLAVENTLPGRLGDNWEDIQQIIQEIHSEYLGICLDTGHYLLNHKSDKNNFELGEEKINLPQYLMHIHIHDNDGRKDLHLLPGEGCFPWSLFLNYLSKIKYQKALIVEAKEQDQIPAYFDRILGVFRDLGSFQSEK